MKTNFTFTTKFTKRFHNNKSKMNTVTVSNFTKAVTKIKTLKNNPHYKHLTSNLMSSFKGLEKIPKSKS